jgi:hypothetical protein
MNLRSYNKHPLIIGIRNLTNSKYLDVIGVFVVLIGAISLGYHKTKVDLNPYYIPYILPLGIISIVNTCISMLSTRMVTKKNNLGNLISTFNTAVSGAVDFLLGNVAAIITYPVSFIANYFCYRSWKISKLLREVDWVFYRNILLGFIVSFILNYIGFKKFDIFSTESIDLLKFFIVAIPAGITFGATFNTARLYPDSWLMWQSYNLFKLIQNVLFKNYANVFKYIFYLFNAIIGYITWKSEDSKEFKLSNK